MHMVQIRKPRELALEEKIDLARRPMPLLFQQQLGLVVHLLHVALPFVERGLILVLAVIRHLLRRALLQVVLVTIHEHHRIRILLD